MIEEASTDTPLIEVDGLKTWFPVRRGVISRTVGHVKAVDGVSLDIRKGETLGLVGESGSGKTTLGRTIIGLEKPYAGTIDFDGERITGMDRARFRELRSNLQIIFQDPFSSLNPRMTVLDLVTEALVEHGKLEGSREEAARRLMDEVRMDGDAIFRYPHEFSGGQRQRISIARALALQPKFIVCDEAVSALDVSVQASVINLFKDLSDKHGLTYLFITHDLSVVRQIADRIAVMHQGRIVETGSAGQVIDDPQHEYTRQLISAVPVVGGRRRR